MTKLEFTNKVIDNLNSSMALNGKINLEKFIDLTNKQYEAIDYTRCCKSDSEQFYCFNKKNKKLDRCMKQCSTCKEMKLM